MTRIGSAVKTDQRRPFACASAEDRFGAKDFSGDPSIVRSTSAIGSPMKRASAA